MTENQELIASETSPEGNTEGSGRWLEVLGIVLKIPHARVDRETFLRTALKPYCDQNRINRIIESGVRNSGIDLKTLDILAENVIRSHTTKATLFSFGAGLPGGLAMTVAISADMAQFYGNAIVAAQKIAYIYGWPDFSDWDSDHEAVAARITVLCGAMFGVEVAEQAIRGISKLVAANLAKQLPKRALTKTAIYPVVKKVAQQLGIKMTKSTFAKGASKAVPILGGVISGGLTLATFPHMAKRLKNALRENVFSPTSPGDNDSTLCSFAIEEDGDDSALAALSETPQR